MRCAWRRATKTWPPPFDPELLWGNEEFDEEAERVWHETHPRRLAVSAERREWFYEKIAENQERYRKAEAWRAEFARLNGFVDFSEVNEKGIRRIENPIFPQDLP